MQRRLSAGPYVAEDDLEGLSSCLTLSTEIKGVCQGMQLQNMLLIAT